MLVIECKIVSRFFKFTASDLIVLVIVQCATFPVRVNASCITNDLYYQRRIAFHIEVLCNIQPMHFPFNRIPAAGKDNIKQKIFPMKSEKVLVIADGAAFGPQMNDIYAYDPDTEEEAGQCMDEVIQIAEESGAEIQFY